MQPPNMHFTRTIILTLLCAGIIAIIFSVWQAESPVPAKPLVIVEFCNRMPRLRIKGRDIAFAADYKLQWKKPRTLNVFFFGANHPNITNQVINVANEWWNYCGMRFQQVTRMTDSQIRITFEQGGYSSAVGIEALEDKYEYSFTMCLEGLDTLQNGELFRRVVLHEFGHALGLEHELQSPAAIIPWDTAALFKYYLDHYRWQRDSVIHQVLTKLENVYYTGFDSTSIMVYAVPDTLTKGDYEIRWPVGLSNTDKSGIAKWYPKNQN